MEKKKKTKIFTPERLRKFPGFNSLSEDKILAEIENIKDLCFQLLIFKKPNRKGRAIKNNIH